MAAPDFLEIRSPVRDQKRRKRLEASLQKINERFVDDLKRLAE